MQVSSKKVYRALEKEVWKDVEALVSNRARASENGASAYAWYCMDRENGGHKEDMELREGMDWRICKCENDKLYCEVCE